MEPQSIAHYRITSKLGEGGMGAVYRATDTKLARDVAIKVLPDAFINDSDRLMRFTREAQVLASLNHPNIAAVYGIEERAIVMELVEGPTLADRLESGAMPIDEALAVARQIAEALEAAHEKGIIHRDLKPANVKLTAEGQVKVLDFGLAKLATPGDAPATAPTLVKGQSPTVAGVIMGTAEYMSPEQAAGKIVDKRTDIWSFGALLFEMLTGRKLFSAETMTQILAEVIRGPLDLALLPSQTPLPVRKLIERCLQRDGKRRLRDIGEARIALEGIASGVIETNPVSRPKLHWLWPAIAALSLTAAAASWFYRTAAPPQPTVNLTRLTGDPGLTMTPAISPDGRLIAYSSDRAGHGDLDIWVQHRGGGDPIQITKDLGDEFDPSFSSDGSQIIYAGNGGLFVVPALGGDPRQVTKGGARAHFSPDGKQIVYQTAGSGNTVGHKIFLLEIGSAEPRVISGDLKSCSSPVWSPDGKYVLFVASSNERSRGDQAEWWLYSAAQGKFASIGPAPGRIEQWLAGDRILFSESPTNFDRRSVAARPSPLSLIGISAARGKLNGAPQRLVNGPSLLDAPSVSNEGTMAIGVGSYRSNLWSLPLDANQRKVQGEPVPLTRDEGAAAYPSISADGKKIAFTADFSGVSKVWILDSASLRRRMLTPTSEAERRPVLSPDGTRVAFVAVSGKQRVTMVADVSADAPGVARKVCDADCGFPWGWWWDNRAFTVFTASGLAKVNVNGGGTKLLVPKRNLYQAHPSPDGKWLVVMVSPQMHMARITDGEPAPQPEWKPVVAGASDLYLWSPDGNTIYFISNRDRFRCIWAQQLKPDTKEPLGQPVPIYHAHGARLSMMSLGDSGAVGLGVAKDRIVFAQGEQTGNIWIGRLETK